MSVDTRIVHKTNIVNNFGYAFFIGFFISTLETRLQKSLLTQTGGGGKEKPQSNREADKILCCLSP